MSNSLCKHCGCVVIRRYIELLVDSGRIVYTINCYQQLRRVALRLRRVWKTINTFSIAFIAHILSEGKVY